MVKVDRTPTPPPSLQKEKAKASGKYNKPDVIKQLYEDFNHKCYLCEIDELQSVEVEHLRPHGENVELKFAWDNLFLCCAHCNSVKNQNKYKNKILDCCKVDPETVLQQELLNGHVKVKATVDSEEAEMTAELLTECFEKTNTGILQIEGRTRLNALSITMDTLYKTLLQYRLDPSEHLLGALRGMLSRASKFSGFTRTYVRTHSETYPDLAEFVKLE